ncbi:MAG: thioredoxin family protein [Thermoplasmata archaeon]
MVIDMVRLYEDIEDGFSKALEENKSVLLHFTAVWCGSCKVQEEILEREVIPLLKHEIVFIRIDVDRHEDMTKQYDVQSIPLLILLSANKREKWRRTGISEREEIERAVTE